MLFRSEGMTEDLCKMEERLNEQVKANIELQNRLNESAKQIIVKEISEGLVDTQKDKLASLAEGVEFTSEEEFSKKLTTIKESYFPKEGAPKVVADETPVEAEEVTPAMAMYLQAMNRWNQ